MIHKTYEKIIVLSVYAEIEFCPFQNQTELYTIFKQNNKHFFKFHTDLSWN